MEPIVIMMNGYTSSLKSTIAKFLQDNYDFLILSTKDFGSLEEKSKLERYKLLAKKISSLIKIGRNIVLDGTFGRNEYRLLVYDALKKINFDRLVIIHSYCNNKKEVERRLKLRDKFETTCFKEWQNEAYDSLINDKFYDNTPNIIDFDSYKFQVKISNANRNSINLINNVITMLKEFIKISR